MKIIKHGKKPEPKILRFECRNCGCVFESEDKECDALGCEGVFGKLEIVSCSIECPECGKRVEYR